MLKNFLFGALVFFAFSSSTLAQEDLAKVFFQAVQKNDPTLLKPWQPTVALVRSLEPGRTKKMSDAAIQKQFLLPLQQKLAQDFAQLYESARLEKLNLQLLQYEGLHFPKTTISGPNRPVVCEILFLYEGKRGSYTVTVLSQEKKWYLFEVLRSVNIYQR